MRGFLGLMKGLLILGVALIAVAAWATRNPAARVSAAPAAGAPSAPVRLTPEQFAAELRENAPLREHLAKQYPDTYSSLAQQSKVDLGKCIVTKVVDGVLKAVCR